MASFPRSNEPKVAAAGFEICTDRKWSTVRELETAEVRLRHKAFVRALETGRSGLDSFLTRQYKGQGQWEERTCRIVGTKQQGAWMKWEGTMERRLTWTGQLGQWFQSIKFLIQAVFGILPSSSNLQLWGKLYSTAYPLRSGREWWWLKDGCYRWHHDQVPHCWSLIILGWVTWPMVCDVVRPKTSNGSRIHHSTSIRCVPLFINLTSDHMNPSFLTHSNE